MTKQMTREIDVQKIKEIEMRPRQFPDRDALLRTDRIVEMVPKFSGVGDRDILPKFAERGKKSRK